MCCTKAYMHYGPQGIPTRDFSVRAPAPRPGHITLEERASRTPWVRSLVVSRALLETSEKCEISCQCRELNYDPAIVQTIS
jgi:hypothetical protein